LCLNWKVKVVLLASGEAARVFSISMPFTKHEKERKKLSIFVLVRTISHGEYFLVDSGLSPFISLMMEFLLFFIRKCFLIF